MRISIFTLTKWSLKWSMKGKMLSLDWNFWKKKKKNRLSMGKSQIKKWLWKYNWMLIITTVKLLRLEQWFDCFVRIDFHRNMASRHGYGYGYDYDYDLISLSINKFSSFLHQKSSMRLV